MVRKANAEATFEKRPRKQAEVAQHRELLPTKEADGSLKRHADGSQEWTCATHPSTWHSSVRVCWQRRAQLGAQGS